MAWQPLRVLCCLRLLMTRRYEREVRRLKDQLAAKEAEARSKQMLADQVLHLPALLISGSPTQGTFQ